MELDTKVKRSLTELNYIINNMSKSLQAKIPNELRESIRDNMDDEYVLDIDISKKYTEQNFMPETKALLSIIISNYIGNEECKKKWKDFDEKYAEILQRNINNDIWDKSDNKNVVKDSETSSKYTVENNSGNISKANSKTSENQLAKYNESFIKRIFKKIMNFFRKRS